MESRSDAFIPVEEGRLRFLRKPLKDILLFFILAGGYVATSKLGFTMAFTAEQITAVWPPTGIALAAILLFGFRVWPAIALGAFFTNATAHEPILTAMGIACGNTLEAVAGAWMLQRLVNFDNGMGRFRDVLGLVFLSAILSTMISATVGVASLCLGGLQGWHVFPKLWLLWWTGDAVGAITVAPFLLAWANALRNSWSADKLAEGAVLLIGLLIALIGIFVEPTATGQVGPAFIYVVFPFVIWAALRFGQQGTSLITLIASGIAIWATLHNIGPFKVDSLDASLMLLQSFMAIVATTGLCLSASKQIDKENKKLVLNLKEEARENERLIAQIREADRYKDEFLAVLAHELRNPLATICNALNVTHLSRKISGASYDVHHLVEKQARQLVRLVDDLLDVSRITRGKIDVRMEKVLLGDVIRNAVETTQLQIKMHKHLLTLQLPDDPIWLKGDATRLAQVFTNLLNNAAKYTENGGHIILKAEADKTHATICVHDNGIGIPLDMLTHIFGLFAQVDHTYERSQGGLGIGLTLARNLLTLHDGTITAKSEGLGKGSEFIVRLPLLTADDEAALSQPEVKELPNKGAESESLYRMLVVDDNKDSAQTLVWMLELLGHEAHSAYDSSSAIALAERIRPDFILLDIGMPVMNGYEVCQVLKQNPHLKNTVFIAQTGWGQTEHLNKSKAAGFDYHLVKPVQPEDLGQIIKTAFVSPAP